VSRVVVVVAFEHGSRVLILENAHLRHHQANDRNYLTGFRVFLILITLVVALLLKSRLPTPPEEVKASVNGTEVGDELVERLLWGRDVDKTVQSRRLAWEDAVRSVLWSGIDEVESIAMDIPAVRELDRTTPSRQTPFQPSILQTPSSPPPPPHQRHFKSLPLLSSFSSNSNSDGNTTVTISTSSSSRSARSRAAALPLGITTFILAIFVLLTTLAAYMGTTDDLVRGTGFAGRFG
jgi:hypothetical protein